MAVRTAAEGPDGSRVGLRTRHVGLGKGVARVASSDVGDETLSRVLLTRLVASTRSNRLIMRIPFTEVVRHTISSDDEVPASVTASETNTCQPIGLLTGMLKQRVILGHRESDVFSLVGVNEGPQLLCELVNLGRRNLKIAAKYWDI